MRLFFKRSPLFYVGLTLLSIVSGLLNMGLLIFINNCINQTPLRFFPQYDWLVFALMIGISFFVSKAFQTHMIRLTTTINYDFELLILRKLKNSSYEDFEKLGEERIYTAINDVRSLGNLPEVLMSAINATIMLVCCFLYLFFISVSGGLFIMGIMVFLLVFYLVRNKAIEKELGKVRDLQDKYYRILNDLIGGFKEIKMSTVRRNTIFKDYLAHNRLETRTSTLETNAKYLTNELTGNYSWYIVFGVIMFLLARLFAVEPKEISTFIITILYLIGPVAVLVTLIPKSSRVKIAIQRLSKFDEIVNSRAEMSESEVPEPLDDFETLRFEDICYEYYDTTQNKTFSFGPLNLELQKQQIVFVTGGNGSGKSTFVNLLTGLYKPIKGKIFYNNVEISRKNFQSYCNRIAVVFTQNYMFEENYSQFDLTKKNVKLMQLIELMELTNLLRIDEKMNRISPRLSKGQQKRLAMIYALLEERPIILLDEWAAEQDPTFRAFFYQKFLPFLKAEGKTVIAITHDDAYYENAERILRFDYGKLTKDTSFSKVNGTLLVSA
jgi:cyclic peptide transporter